MEARAWQFSTVMPLILLAVFAVMVALAAKQLLTLLPLDEYPQIPPPSDSAIISPVL
ncbi:MAG: hypothetical protein LBJ47_10715 [Tannerella sp.]|nr:hypothetical protein [Tannerella sp.]